MNWIRKTNRAVGKAVSWLTAGLVLLLSVDVIIRYLFRESQAWVTELEWHVFALIFLLGAGYTFLEDKHVRVDVFYARFSDKDKAWVDFVGNLVLLVPWSLTIILIGIPYVLDAYRIGEGSPDPGGLPARWLIKAVIPIGFFLLLLQSIDKLRESWLVIRRSKSEN